MTEADKAEMIADARAYLRANGIRPTRKAVLAQVAAERGQAVANAFTRAR